MKIRPPPRAILSLPPCDIGIHETADGKIAAIVFLPPGGRVESNPTPVELLARIAIQLSLENAGNLPALPFAPVGTPFQNAVWQAIRAIPRGETRHYSDLAQSLSSSARAVGQACGDNPFPILTPCHRVLAKSGPGGFAHASAGWLLDTKRWLLEQEVPWS